ncbi:MAG: dienelactone hydrolase [Nodularia sp. (in: Bacteria)]|nr:MAG: dienelactone hydrolase [Nodularia sp. (in: cyanobacteria)]
MVIRAFFEAAKVEGTEPPYDTIHLKIFYPGQISGSDLEKNLGVVTVDPEKAPFPVVIFFNGINCEAQTYQWLAIKLAELGMVVVLFNWIAENLPGFVSITPGVDVEKLKPEFYRNFPTTSALPTLLKKLEQLQTKGILAGLLDLKSIILGGHSAGGRVAIENADPQFFPQVVAAFGYGVHTAGPLMAGYEAGTIMPLPDSLPLLIMGGTCDGMISNSSHRYGVSPGDATTPVIRTFHEALAGGRNDSYLLLLEGANHFSIVDSFDSATGSLFLDFPATQPQEKFRLLMAEIIGLFINSHVRHEAEAALKLEKLLNTDHFLINSFKLK